MNILHVIINNILINFILTFEENKERYIFYFKYKFTFDNSLNVVNSTIF